MAAPDRQKKPVTWREYRKTDEGEVWEIIGGTAYDMSAAPTPRHQRIVGALYRALGRSLHGKTCAPLISPVDVKLSDTDVVQPDLFVICDPTQEKATHIEGAPALVIEVLSPSTSYHDRIRKLELYARSGVREVWLVTPFPSSVEVFVLRGGQYQVEILCGDETDLTSPTLPEITVHLTDIFDFPIEPGEDLHLVKEARPMYTKISE
jgi:Uma2 family endonuclease